MVLASDLLTGIYLSLVPVSNDRPLVPLFMLCVVTILLLKVGNAKGGLTSFLMLLVIVITIIFLLGGREKAMQRLSGMTRPVAAVPHGSPAQPLMQNLPPTQKPLPGNVPGWEANRICDDAANADMDFRNKTPPYIEVTLHPGCWSGYLRLPTAWHMWEHSAAGDTKGWWVGLWYNGQMRGSGPYHAYEIQQVNFHNVQPALRLQGNGRIRFYSNVKARTPAIRVSTLRAAAMPAPPDGSAKEAAKSAEMVPRKEAATRQMTPTDPTSRPSMEYEMQVLQCAHSGNAIHCWGLVNNATGTPSEMALAEGSAVDSLGYSFGFSGHNARPGHPASFTYPGGGSSNTLIPNSPTRFTIAISDAHAEVKNVSLRCLVRWKGMAQTLIFEHVPVQ